MIADRKAALERYKDRKVEAGVYKLSCLASGACWVGRAPDLSTIGNRIWFTLRHGGHSNKALQAAWNAHGADAIAFEIVEALEHKPEDSAYMRDRALKARLEHWREALNADPI
jgi:hypothetical protein